MPKGVDYDLWLGPAPQRPFNRNRFHYEWHWNWDYGTGEIGNNGIHGLDLARWLLDLDAPTRVSAGGGKLFYDDDRQTPDTHIATFDFPNTTLIWEHRIWSRTGFDGQSFSVALYGERGTLICDGRGWRIIDGIEGGEKAVDMERPHLRNFIDCIKQPRRPNADIEDGHKSTRLCHLGNIAYRTGHTVHLDPHSHQIVNDKEASALWGRAYRSGWEPKI